jgi:sulfur carrier protein ThiS
LKKTDTIDDEEVRPQLTIQVKLADFLAKLVPEAKFEIKINAGSTLEELMAFLTERLGDEFRRAVIDRNGKLHADIAVVVNNRFIPPQQFAELTIHETSSFSIIPIAGGG